MSGFIIAIDGPSASGKSTVSRTVARELGCRHIDSGALYRAVTWHALQQGLAANDAGRLAQWVNSARFSLPDESNARLAVDDKSPSDNDLRGEAVVEAVSDVAAVPDVRRAVNKILRRMAAQGSVVVEGRDIGTVVFPQTPFKFFLDADPQERARRRCLETDGETGKIKESLEKRDLKDRSRRAAPLRRAPDAMRIDTTRLSVRQVADRIIRNVTGKLS